MSITRDQFHIQIDRLVDTFGDKAFSDQRSHMIWETVDGLPYPTVIAIVDGFIAGAKHAPLPNDFKKAASETGIRSLKFSLGETHPNAACDDCGDSGLIRLQRKPEFEEWARWEIGSAPCHCHRGKMAIEACKRRPREPLDLGPQFSDHWLKSYEIVPGYRPKNEGEK